MYNIYINLIVVSVDLKSQKKYILSKKQNEIVIPRINLSDFNLLKLKYDISEYIRKIIPMNILGILPQIINLHSQTLSNTYKKLNIHQEDQYALESVYGCLVDYINPSNLNEYFWIEFAYEIPNDYSANIFEVCQYLR